MTVLVPNLNSRGVPDSPGFYLEQQSPPWQSWFLWQVPYIICTLSSRPGASVFKDFDCFRLILNYIFTYLSRLIITNSIKIIRPQSISYKLIWSGSNNCQINNKLNLNSINLSLDYIWSNLILIEIESIWSRSITIDIEFKIRLISLNRDWNNSSFFSWIDFNRFRFL